LEDGARTSPSNPFPVLNIIASLSQHPHPVEEAKGWHTDNDYYRQFLDSSTNALTIINCFTDVKPGQGGTFLAEDGIKGIVDFLYEHPEGLDPPFSYLYRHVKSCKKFLTVSVDPYVSPRVC
jgi:hypothetical protein